MTNRQKINSLKNPKLENYLNSDICPECGEGYLQTHSQVIKDELVYFAKCHNCGYSEGTI